MIRSLISAAVAGLVGYTTTKIVMTSKLRSHEKVVRTNHAGRDVSLVEGPAVTAGLVAGGLLIEAPRQRAATLLVTTVAGGLGAVDDFLESGDSKGLRGHLSALAQGQITTGGIKVVGIPLASIAAATILRTGRSSQGLFPSNRTAAEKTWCASTVDVVVTGGVIAGTANLFNLLDLRPGRALKAGLLTLAFMPHEHGLTWAPGAAIAGSSAAAWPDDLGGEVMLGDTGANALGAGLGTILAENSTATQRALVLSGLVGLTLLSEKVSFTSVIESTPGLREIDAFGREAV
ncbi:hypothetical protein [Brevibacterium marinum]|uniref:UDP-N-acetylmuramyl pentapeptide phosphotransferase/UDP-N-acetylglucosamine-1-phosphate transferase n=1 Tax=Brevibacterium marinum TaxID=418643 RepID=A0A846RSS1_9MICO|nr:hypothetical protein [Brevibacterium marinum]NJC57114.1 UDP-N-acetylmuramyl pentapeptide phosphotransferase/UDP-N-acetylglucosamine-1-phosphate transferase [Brevibacterium marinum]